MVSKGIPLDSEDRGILESLRSYTDDLLRMSEGVTAVRKQAKELMRLNKEMESLIAKKVNEKLDKTLLEMRK